VEAVSPCDKHLGSQQPDKARTQSGAAAAKAKSAFSALYTSPHPVTVIILLVCDSPRFQLRLALLLSTPPKSSNIISSIIIIICGDGVTRACLCETSVVFPPPSPAPDTGRDGLTASWADDLCRISPILHRRVISHCHIANRSSVSAFPPRPLTSSSVLWLLHILIQSSARHRSKADFTSAVFSSHKRTPVGLSVLARDHLQFAAHATCICTTSIVHSPNF
jgi:hypothetical protein